MRLSNTVGNISKRPDSRGMTLCAKARIPQALCGTRGCCRCCFPPVFFQFPSWFGVAVFAEECFELTVLMAHAPTLSNKLDAFDSFSIAIPSFEDVEREEKAEFAQFQRDMYAMDDPLSDLGTYYQPPPPDVDAKIHLYFEAKRSGRETKKFIKDSMTTHPSRRVLCARCCGKHDTYKCLDGMAIYKSNWICLLCGAKGHQRKSCPRRRCWVCLQIGHTAREKHPKVVADYEKNRKARNI